MSLYNLYSASFYSTQASVYFNRVLLVSSLAQHPDATVSSIRESFFQELKMSGRDYVNNIQFSNEIYLELGLPPMDLPRFPDDYFSWVTDFRSNLRSVYEDKSVEQLIIDYSFYMASVCADLSLLIWSLKLQIEAPETSAQKSQIESSLIDLTNSKFAWAAQALLLGTNVSMRFLWEEWQSIDSLLEQFLGFNIILRPENREVAMNFIEALLAKIEERNELIFSRLETID